MPITGLRIGWVGVWTGLALGAGVRLSSDGLRGLAGEVGPFSPLPEEDIFEFDEMFDQ